MGGAGGARGEPKRIALIAADLVTHFEKRVEAMIVCMSRRICVDLFNALIKLRTEWDAEMLKVVMTGSAEDGPDWQRRDPPIRVQSHHDRG